MKKILAALDKREALLKTQVRSVIQSYTNAVFVHGPGGLGKTHIITSELDALCGAGWKHHTAYSTPKALMLSIAELPDSIHVFEDCEKLYKTDVASSILRAACGSPRQRDRWITYETAHETLRVNFRGGIIIVSNENLARCKGPLAAVASRFRPILWDLSAEERIAKILSLAEAGWSRGEWTLTPKECRIVAQFLVEEMVQGDVHVPVDLRTYVEHAVPAYCQARASNGTVDWKDVIRSKLQGQVQHVEKRAEKSDRLQLLALGLAGNKTLTGKQRIAEWKKQTGLGQAIYYRHLRSAKTSK